MNDPFLSGISGVIIGGLITGIFSICAVILTNKHNMEVLETKEAKVLRGLLQALHTEIDCVFEHYKKTAGEYLKNTPNKGKIIFYYPVLSDYFTVYNENASMIGRIENDELRKLLVETYVKAKSLIDSFKMNNEHLSKYEQLNEQAIKTNCPVDHEKVVLQNEYLNSYGDQIRNSHAEMTKCVDKLLQLLDKERNDNQAKSTSFIQDQIHGTLK
ncbi:MAG: hypothetical protein WCI64_07450 [Chlorobium sp.]